MSSLVECDTATASGTAAIQKTLTVGAAVGDDLYVIAAQDDTTAMASGSITDSKGHTWVLDQQGLFHASGRRFGIWSTRVTSALVAGTDWVRFGSTGSNKIIHVLKGLSMASAPTVDKKQLSNNQAATAAPTTGTTTATAQADEIAIALYGIEGNPTFTPPSGWSQPTTTKITNGSKSLCVCYKILTATGTQVAVAGLSPSADAGGIIATYKGTAANPQKSRSMRVVSNSGGFTREDGTTNNLEAGTNETTPNDSTYVQSPVDVSAPRVMREKIDPYNPPAGGGQIMKTRYVEDATGSLTMNLKSRLYQGGGNTEGAGTLVKERTFLNVGTGVVEDDYSLSGGEVALITDPGELYHEIEVWHT